jgi:hypothetical protein
MVSIYGVKRELYAMPSWMTNSTMELRSLAAQQPDLNESGMCTLGNVSYIHISVSVQRHCLWVARGAHYGALDHRLVTEYGFNTLYNAQVLQQSALWAHN